MPSENDQTLPSSAETQSSLNEFSIINYDPRAELAAVEVEVTKVSMMLAHLVHKTHMLKERINDIYSPAIRLLPPEIISEIFQFCLPAFTLYSVNETDTFVPLTLGSICSAWRRIAWGTPTLWTTLILHLSHKTINTQVILLAECLSRSGDLPLSIRLYSDEDIHWTPPSTPGTAIEIINRYSSRWRDLDLRLPTSCYKYLPPSEEPLPLLTSLHLNPPGGQGERRHKVDMSKSAQIKQLSLSCVYLASVKFQWDQVTHLRLEAFYVDECLEALRQAPQVVSCSLRNIIGGDDGHPLPNSPTLLLSLKTFSIDNEKDTPISLLLDTISFPNATEFSYSGRSLIHVPQLCALISRSSSLQTFSLIRTNITNENVFVQLLQALKSIPKITFSMPSVLSSQADSLPFNDNILRLCNPILAAESHVDCLLPALEEIEYTGPKSFSWSTLLETLESRQPSGLWDPGKVNLDDISSRPGSAVDLRSAMFALTQRDSDITESDDIFLSRLQALSANGMNVGVAMTSTDAEGKIHPRSVFER